MSADVLVCRVARTATTMQRGNSIESTYMYESGVALMSVGFSRVAAAEARFKCAAVYREGILL